MNDGDVERKTDKEQGFRTGRHCVFAMHVHLIFVSKYRRKVFDGDAIERLGAHLIIKQYVDQQSRPL